MSNADEDRTIVLARVTSEWQAQLIADVLKDQGIDAAVSGALTANFRAEAPGLVKVIVPGDQIDNARAALDAHREAVSEIDWEQVDVNAEE